MHASDKGQCENSAIEAVMLVNVSCVCRTHKMLKQIKDYRSALDSLSGSATCRYVKPMEFVRPPVQVKLNRNLLTSLESKNVRSWINADRRLDFLIMRTERNIMKT